MQLNAITRKSALAALMLLVAVLVAVAVRFSVVPFAFEQANSPFSERTLSIVVAMFLFLCGGVVEGKILPRSGLSKGYCTLPIPLYGVLACGIFLSPHTLTTAVTSFCFALAILLILRSLHSADEKDSLFFASLLLGVMVLLYPPSIVLALVLPLSVFILALSLRQFVIMLLGYALPLLAASYAMWYGGSGFWDLSHNVVQAVAMPRMGDISTIPYVAIVMLVAVVVVLLWGLVYALIRPDKMFMLTRIRRALHLFIWLFAMTLTIAFVPACDISVLAIIAIPVTILLSLVLSILPNNHSTIAYWVLLALFVLHLFVE